LSRSVLAAAILAATTALASSERGQLDASPSLFAVLAALNAAGYDAELESPNNHPLRAQIRQELAKKKVPSVAELKLFLEAHKQRNSTAELSQYISFALSADGPPDFALNMRTVEIPPDVAPLEGLGPLLAKFYQEADIEGLWNRSQPAFEQLIAKYHQPVTQAVLDVNTYLRSPTGNYLGRRFQIYIDVLGAPNQIQARSYGQDYYVVLTHSAEPQTSDVRHGYLHYLLDPLATKYAQDVMKKRGLSDFAQGAPALAEHYKSDFLLLVTESLIKAIESKLDRKREVVDEALKEGFILAPFFWEQLPVYEKQDQAMRLYFPELIAAVDVKKEEARLANVTFTSSARVRHAKVVPQVKKAEPVGAYKTLEEAEQLYSNRDLERAKEAYRRVLQQTADRPAHAKSYYGLGRIAILQKDPETAERLLQKVLESSPEPAVKAWAYVYLGRLADVSGEREQASSHYRNALATEGASMAARNAAQQGMEQSFKKP